MRKRREPVKDNGKSSLLKSRLSSRRRRSIDNQSLSSNLFRSQSVCGVDSVGVEEHDVTASATETRRSRRRAHAQSADVSGAMSMLSLNTTDSLDTSGVSAGSDSFSAAEKSSVDSPREVSNLTRSRSIASSLRQDGAESIGSRMRQRLSRSRLVSEDSADSPTHSPEVTSVRMPPGRRTPDSRPSQPNASQRGSEARI